MEPPIALSTHHKNSKILLQVSKCIQKTLEVEGEVDPQDVVVDPGFLGIFKGAEEVREGELGSFMVGDFKSCLEAVLIEPSCLLPKEFVSEKGGNVFPREADGRNVFCPVAVDPSVISAERFT